MVAESPQKTCVLAFFIVTPLQVYNKNRTADEFMGSSSLYLKDFDLYK